MAPEGFVRVGAAGDFVEGVIQSVAALDGEVAVVRWKDRFFAFGNRCTHMGMAMRWGYVTDADEVVCPVHTAVYDLATGLALDVPRYPFGGDLPVYAVQVEAGEVYVGHGP